MTDGWRFSLKGSPRFYDDVLRIIESDPGAEVYFGEALTYERGAAVALWRVRARQLRLAASPLRLVGGPGADRTGPVHVLPLHSAGAEVPGAGPARALP